MKSVGCYDVNTTLVGNYTCFLKPTRDGGGRATFWASNVTRTSDIWAHIQVFYRYRTSFRLWQINWDIDICKSIEDTLLVHKYLKIYADELNRHSENILHKCPYEGPVGTVNINYGQVFENVVPQVLPRGTYKVQFRYYRKKDNITMMILFGVAEVSAVDVMKNYDMGK